jgi:hypothetical protein
VLFSTEWFTRVNSLGFGVTSYGYLGKLVPASWDSFPDSHENPLGDLSLRKEVLLHQRCFQIIVVLSRYSFYTAFVSRSKGGELWIATSVANCSVYCSSISRRAFTKLNSFDLKTHPSTPKNLLIASRIFSALRADFARNSYTSRDFDHLLKLS